MFFAILPYSLHTNLQLTMVLPVPGGPYTNKWRRGALREWARATDNARPPTLSRSEGANTMPLSTASSSPTDGNVPVTLSLSCSHRPRNAASTNASAPRSPLWRLVSRTSAGLDNRLAKSFRSKSDPSRAVNHPPRSSTSDASTRARSCGCDARCLAPLPKDQNAKAMASRARSKASSPSARIARSSTSSFKRARAASSAVLATADSSSVERTSRSRARSTLA